ncbi:integrase domain containing protein [Plakobranchus ocellatus]|uniref:Integrase domain containing protein n=1 Tax=Plakobranchus ocellatus TaxID=259542 RepID=A0AAV3ZBN5_9GAST|nr:integrase domain containing protein [Plakobranchus ocellatus]
MAQETLTRTHVDFAGPLMNSMFLVVVDAHSKWTEIISLSNATSITIISIPGNLFARFGLPEQLVTHNGTQFSLNEFKSFTRSNGIKHTFSPPYHPATKINGLGERME